MGLLYCQALVIRRSDGSSPSVRAEPSVCKKRDCLLDWIMMNGSVRVLAPATMGAMSGMPGTMYRSVFHNAAALPRSYFEPILRLVSRQRDDDETDFRSGEELSGNSTAARDSQGRSGNGGGGGGRVSSSHGGFHQYSPRSGNGPNATATMHIDDAASSSRRSTVMEIASSRDMVLDYVRHCLEKEGIAWQNGQRDATPSEIQAAMRALGDNMAARYGEDFARYASSLNLTSERGREQMTLVMKELFGRDADEVSWGRIVSLVVFAGKLAVQCAKRRRPAAGPAVTEVPAPELRLLDSLVDWVSTYLDTDEAVRAWVASNNGWAGFVEFNRNPESHSKESWPQLKTVFTVFAAAVGALTLGALMKS
eukprot:TRINITY_DN57827_c0_g2_i1.p1 TRINITY_DN57827_c0_g2~~TRINITY_DN57827_c0_g2_i1.p1  ORF type:complete len:366 (-),score=55.61 TRINITY_DN57827_c0_g2_i1:302-1399(-)